MEYNVNRRGCRIYDFSTSDATASLRVLESGMYGQV